MECEKVLIYAELFLEQKIATIKRTEHTFDGENLRICQEEIAKYTAELEEIRTMKQLRSAQYQCKQLS